MKSFTDLTDLAQARLGGRAITASDEFFAPKENLLEAHPPVFKPDAYTDHGKLMDGWESRRRRDDGHDWCIIQLAVPGVIRGVDVDTTHFKGNHPPACSIDALPMITGEGHAGEAVCWETILERAPLDPDSSNVFPIDATACYSAVRLNIFPDGGVARFRVYGTARPDWNELIRVERTPDLAAARHGGRILDCSDRFFSAPQNLLMPGRGVNMGDGWETRRRRGPGHDWCIIALGRRGIIETIEVDTAHFKGNFPDRCSVEIADVPIEDATLPPGTAWHELLPEQALQADHVHVFEVDSARRTPGGVVRFNMFPDGGVSRLRLHGEPFLAEPAP